MSTRKAKAEDEPAPKTVTASREVPACSNCGEPAEWRTVNPGAETAYFCDYHAGLAYGLTSGKLAPL